MTFTTFWAIVAILLGCISLIISERSKKSLVRKGLGRSSLLHNLVFFRTLVLLLPALIVLGAILAAYRGTGNWHEYDELDSAIFAMACLFPLISAAVFAMSARRASKPAIDKNREEQAKTP